MKYSISFLIILVSLSAHANPKSVSCDLVDNLDTRAVIGSLEANFENFETKIKLMSSENTVIVNDQENICGISMETGKFEVKETTLGSTTFYEEQGAFVQDYRKRFSKIDNGFIYYYDFFFFYTNAKNKNTGEFRCKEEGDADAGNNPLLPQMKYLLQDCKTIE